MGISIWQLLIILVIVILLFGTKRLKNIGSDIGGALKGFKKAVDDGEGKKDDSIEPAPVQHQGFRISRPKTTTGHSQYKSM